MARSFGVVKDVALLNPLYLCLYSNPAHCELSGRCGESWPSGSNRLLVWKYCQDVYYCFSRVWQSSMEGVWWSPAIGYGVRGWASIPMKVRAQCISCLTGYYYLCIIGGCWSLLEVDGVGYI